MTKVYQTSETEVTTIESKQSSFRGYSSEDVLKLITATKALDAISIDLSQKNLTDIPEELYGLEQVEYLYLEGNLLESLPDELFEKLPSLKWLDLRFNKITTLPDSCGKPRFLKTLLLEGNKLTELPPELGLMRSLCGLNLRGNPLDFPPKRVLEKGVKEILGYLRDALAIKEQKLKPTDLRIDNLNLENSTTASSESDSEYGMQQSLDSYDQYCQPYTSPSRQSLLSLTSNASDLEFPRPRSVSLHKHMSYEEYRQLQYERFKKAGALGVLGKDRKKKKKKAKSVKPVYIDPMEAKFMEERQREKLRKLRDKQTLMEQRLKDQRLLDDWRDESLELQRKHYIRAVTQGKNEFTEPMDFPYDVDEEYMKIMSNEQRIKKEVRDKLDKERTMKPTSRQKMEKAKLKRDRQLMEKIKQHTQRVQERKNKPTVDPKEQLEAAKRDLEMANQLQGEVNNRRRELEYRFRAFTGDSSPIP